MPEVGRLERFAHELLKATAAGRLIWTTVAGEPRQRQEVSFMRRSGGARIHPRDWDGIEPFVFELLNSDGVPVQTYETHWTTDENGDSVRTTLSEIIVDLYAAATESAVASLIDSVLAEIRVLEEPF